MRTALPNRVLLAFSALLLAAAIALSAVYRKASRQRVLLANGATLEWLGVTIGTNSFRQGSPVELLLAPWLPAAGMSIGKITLARPTIFPSSVETDATAWLALKGTNMPIQNFQFSGEGALLISSNQSGRQFSITGARGILLRTNEMILQIPLRAFPRDQKTVQLLLSPSAVTGLKREWFTFEFKNPLPKPPPAWAGQPLPATVRTNGLEFTIVSTETNLITVEMPDEWKVADCRITDDEGNSFSRFRGSFPRDRLTIVSFDHGLETNRAWRVALTFIKNSDYPQAPIGLPPEERHQVRLIQSAPAITLTNAAGEEFICRLSGQELQIQRKEGNQRPYWALLSRTHYYSAGWKNSYSPQPVQVWQLTTAPATLDLELACVPVIFTEFCLQPSAQ